MYGARPLKRTLQRQVLDKLAMQMLQGEFHEGDVVRIDAPRGELEFTRAGQAVHA
jgi:ATP-dependent Clp protease ATP-binding subunit ClpB